MTNIQVVENETVTASTILGRIGNISNSGSIPNHLHFVVYEGTNEPSGLKSMDVLFVERSSGLIVTAHTAGNFITNDDPSLFASAPLEIRVESQGEPVPNAAVFLDGVQIGTTEANGVLTHRHPLDTPLEETKQATISVQKDELSASTTIILYESQLIKPSEDELCTFSVNKDMATWWPVHDFVSNPLNFILHFPTPLACMHPANPIFHF